MSNLIDTLSAHLDHLDQDPSMPLDQKLFSECSLVLPRSLPKDSLTPIASKLASLVIRLTTDPTPAIDLLLILLSTHTYAEITALAPHIDFASGLSVDAAPFNALILHIIDTAADSHTDALDLIRGPCICRELCTLWMNTEDIGIADKCSKVLLKLLNTEKDSADEQEMPIWHTILSANNVDYFMHTCSMSVRKCEMDEAEQSIAQGRLLGWLLDLVRTRQSFITQGLRSKKLYPANSAYHLLTFALDMVDEEKDVLMHVCLLQFMTGLLLIRSDGDNADTLSPTFELLVPSFVQDNTMHLYLNPEDLDFDPLDLSLLRPEAARFVAAYASMYPKHFSESGTMSQVLTRLKDNFDISPGQWASQSVPLADLHVLSSLPRESLLPPKVGRTFQGSPVALLPTKTTHPAVLDTLATIFHGPLDDKTAVFPVVSPMVDHVDTEAQAETDAAKRLYQLYLSYNPRMHQDLELHARTLAVPELAVAAERLQHAIKTARWAL